MSNINASKFISNMGTNAPFYKALKDWNTSNKLKSWCVPARGTPEHEEVMVIMRQKYTKKKEDKKNEQVSELVSKPASKPVSKPASKPASKDNTRPTRNRKTVQKYNPSKGK